MARGPRALRPMENQPTAHRARTLRCGLGAVVFAANSRRAPPHTDGRGSWRIRHARSVATAYVYRSRRFVVPWRAARARFAPWRTSRPPTEHALCAADLARLSARSTCDALHPTPLADTLLQRHCAGSAAAASQRHNRLSIVPWRAARSCFVTWSDQPTAHRERTARCGLGAVVCAANSLSLPPTSLAEAPGVDTAPGRWLRLRSVVAVSF